MRQCDAVGQLLGQPRFRGDEVLSKQINRASVSVPNNIAEGFVRKNDTEFFNFLRIATASNGEVRSSIMIAVGRNYLTRKEAPLLDQNDAIGRMIRRLQSTLNPQPRSGSRRESR